MPNATPKNRYWISADKRNTESVFEAICRCYIEGKTVTDTCKESGLSRPSVTKAFYNIGGRFAYWNQLRLQTFYFEVRERAVEFSLDYASASQKEFIYNYLMEWVRQIKDGACLKNRCNVCLKFARHPTYQFTRKRYEKRRNCGTMELMRLLAVGFARKYTADRLLSSRKHCSELGCALKKQQIDVESDLVTDVMLKIVLSWFEEYPVGSKTFSFPHPETFGPIGTYKDEKMAQLSLVGSQEEVSARYSVHLSKLIEYLNHFAGKPSDLHMTQLEKIIYKEMYKENLDEAISRSLNGVEG